MTLPCKWVTDEAGPLVCKKGEGSYSWSICASAAECSGALSARKKWPQTKAITLVESSAAAIRSPGGRPARRPKEPSTAGSPNQRIYAPAAD